MKSASSKLRRPTFWPESALSITIALNVPMRLPPLLRCILAMAAHQGKRRSRIGQSLKSPAGGVLL
jgi:hypothetical protein